MLHEDLLNRLLSDHSHNKMEIHFCFLISVAVEEYLGSNIDPG